ncbi:SDR family oxidoreductase [Agrococcus sp. BE272]|uniref:SDR family oxidoreductase n=1 Tax=Agrococcus sp. BE272 TaxID=2817727 RepID=UPI0028654E86|nr:SDR family oxidoreductase [Agrococcus sp. BE272]MDR7233582.1 NAD(P)-dependent dehydrogenase (short-subunit alcohol dehydrogenase family) [Agrococcus sp. BE272]
MAERVLITGGGRGIGAATAERCRAEGWEPITIDLRDGDIAADLGDPDSTRKALEEALADGPITRLVNNVGMIDVAAIEDVTLDQLDRVVRVNLQSALLAVQALLPGMKEAGFGRIVNIASRAALGKEGRTTYAATKAGLLGATRTWALELGAHSITVNAIGPGPIETPLFSQANPPGAPATQQIIDSIPVRRMGQPEDIAHAVAGFLDSRAGFTTGQTLYVCGGKTVGLVTV